MASDIWKSPKEIKTFEVLEVEKTGDYRNRTAGVPVSPMLKVNGRTFYVLYGGMPLARKCLFVARYFGSGKFTDRVQKYLKEIMDDEMRPLSLSCEYDPVKAKKGNGWVNS